MADVPLRTDGPTPEEWVKAGYRMQNYPPAGYAAKPRGAPRSSGAKVNVGTPHRKPYVPPKRLNQP